MHHPIPADTPEGVHTGADGHEYAVTRELTGRYAIDGLCITEVQERVTYRRLSRSLRARRQVHDLAAGA